LKAMGPVAADRRDLLSILALALAPAIGLGLSRFAYALVLPDMRASLSWSYAEAGGLNAVNALGYLFGAGGSVAVMARLGAFRTALLGAVLCVVSLGVCAFAEAYPTLALARFGAGLGGGFAFVAGGVLATSIAQRQPRRSAFLLGLFYAGVGFGILVSGLVLPPLHAAGGAGSWHGAWLALTALALAMTLGLLPARAAGGAEGPGGQARAALKPMLAILAAYLVFGAGYIAYMTFMIAWVQNLGEGAMAQTLFWSVIGLGAMAFPWTWAFALKRLRHGFAFAALTALSAAAAALPLLTSARPGLLVSGALFGSTLLAVVTATTVFVRRNLPAARWPSGIGAMTVAFGVGQTAGPLLTGLVTDLGGGLAGGLWASVGLLLVAAAIGAMQRDLVPPAP
jgi:predicted MFS family arabinose efflux permease